MLGVIVILLLWLFINGFRVRQGKQDKQQVNAETSPAPTSPAKGDKCAIQGIAFSFTTMSEPETSADAN